MNKTMQPRQESNLYQKFRKLLFYPLNYGAVDYLFSLSKFRNFPA